MNGVKRCWALSLGLHVLVALVAAGVTVAEGEVEGERGCVRLVSEFQPSAWAWLDERVEPHEGLSDELNVSTDLGTQGPDLTVPDLWDYGDQLLESSTNKPGRFEDDDEVGSPGASVKGCACRKSPCTCEPVSIGNVAAVCTCDQDFSFQIDTK